LRSSRVLDLPDRENTKVLPSTMQLTTVACERNNQERGSKNDSVVEVSGKKNKLGTLKVCICVLAVEYLASGEDSYSGHRKNPFPSYS